MSALIDTIKKHIVEEGDCWNWTGALQSCGSTPTMRWQGKTGAVRRFILCERGPNQVAMFATYKCGNPQCVNPEHATWAARRTIQRRTTAELGHQSDLLRCKKLADKARAKAKLDMPTALAIREAEGVQHEIAARFGVSQATVSKIKRCETWRTYGASPFAGLGAR